MFATTLVVGDVPASLLEDGCGPIESLSATALATDADGRIPLAALIELGAGRRRANSLVLVVTDRDLSTPELASLFGFTDRRAGVAVISTSRLIDPADSDRLGDRLRNEIAHELGHLRGLEHCRHPGCVMAPVTAAHEIDERSLEPCGHCPRSRPIAVRIGGVLFGVAFLVLSVLALNRVMVSAFGDNYETPFICVAEDALGHYSMHGTGPEDHATILFEHTPVGALRDKGGHSSIRARSVAAVMSLNDLWRDAKPLRLRVTAAPSGARVEANGVTVLDVLPGDVDRRDARLVAAEWTENIARAFRAGLRPVEIVEPER